MEKARIGVTGLSGKTRYPEGVISLGFYQPLRDAFPEAESINANLTMERARFVRSEEELAFITQADAAEVLRREARPGVPESVVYARILASFAELAVRCRP